MITEDYVSYEVAKLLKEKGFDETCYQKYDNEGYLAFNHVGYINDEKPCDDFYALAPTIQMAMKWLRKVYGIIIIIDYDEDEDCEANERYGFTIYRKNERKVDFATYPTYEDTVEAALKYCLTELI